MSERTCEVLVIGAGPGGYAAAIRAGQLGLDTVIVEAEALGGTCLNFGCIPSKALLHAADEYDGIARATADDSPLGIRAGQVSIDLAATMAWKDGVVERLTGGIGSLLNRAGVETVRGWAQVVDGKTVEVDREDGRLRIATDNLILATGSRAVELPDLPFGDRVLSSTDALAVQELPERLLIVGGGYIGLELGTAFAKLGSQVTVAEMAGQLLPAYDEALIAPVAHRLEALGVEVRLESRVTAYDPSERVSELAVTAGSPERVEADAVLVAVGRVPAVDGWGLTELDLDRQGLAVRVDEHCRTSMRGVYAIGDLTGEPMLAHRAIAQGELVAEIVAGAADRWDKVAVPAVVFTDPQIVTVGLSPKDAETDVITGQFPFVANGRAMTTEDTAGFVRVVAREVDHVVVGLQAVGDDVSELSASFALALEMGARLEDLADTIHAHPTRSEALQEAAMQALGRAIHI